MSTTIGDCLSTLGVSLDTLASRNGLAEEWAVLKKAYFKAALANHPDKGGDAAVFRKVQAAFEALRALFDATAVASFAASASKNVDAQVDASSAVPSWQFYADAADEPVPIYRVEPAKSGRSKCAATGAAKKCGEGECIPKGALRVGWLNSETGTYGNWVRLTCWRVPSKVWLGLESCTDADQYKAALLSMSSVVLSGVGELTPAQASDLATHCMDKAAWAALVTRKQEPAAQKVSVAATAVTAATAASSSAAPAVPAASSSALGKAPASSALVAEQPGEKKRFVIPVPGKDGPNNSLAGKTVVLTGIFPEVGGGAGLDLGKARVKAMVESFGGKVTGSVSGRTDVLIVGKEPGASKVGAARSNPKCTLMSLEDVRQGLLLGSLAAVSNGKAPMVITNFSAGYRGNGIGYAIKAPEPPKPAPPKPPAAPPAPTPKPSTAATAAPPPAAAAAAAAKDENTDEQKLPPKKAPAARKPAAPKAKPVAEAKGKGKKRKAAGKARTDLWIAVEPIAPPKKLRGPPKDRSRS